MTIKHKIRDSDINSHSRIGSHVSQEQHNKAMQRKIDHLKKKLRHSQRKRIPTPSDSSSDDEKDSGYWCRSRTPPSESFSYEEKHHRERRCKSPSTKRMGSIYISVDLLGLKVYWYQNLLFCIWLSFNSVLAVV